MAAELSDQTCTNVRHQRVKVDGHYELALKPGKKLQVMDEFNFKISIRDIRRASGRSCDIDIGQKPSHFRLEKVEGSLKEVPVCIVISASCQKELQKKK